MIRVAAGLQAGINVLLAIGLVVTGFGFQAQDRHIDRLEHRIEILESGR